MIINYFLNNMFNTSSFIGMMPFNSPILSMKHNWRKVTFIWDKSILFVSLRAFPWLICRIKRMMVLIQFQHGRKTRYLTRHGWTPKLGPGHESNPNRCAISMFTSDSFRSWSRGAGCGCSPTRTHPRHPPFFSPHHCCHHHNPSRFPSSSSSPSAAISPPPSPPLPPLPY